jgi:hypothetical protein
MRVFLGGCRCQASVTDGYQRQSDNPEKDENFFHRS